MVVSATVGAGSPARAEFDSEQRVLVERALDALIAADGIDKHILMPQMAERYDAGGSAAGRQQELYQLVVLTAALDSSRSYVRFAQELLAQAESAGNPQTVAIARMILDKMGSSEDRGRIPGTADEAARHYGARVDLRFQAVHKLVNLALNQNTGGHGHSQVLNNLYLELLERDDLVTERFALLWFMSNRDTNINRRYSSMAELVRVARDLLTCPHLAVQSLS